MCLIAVKEQNQEFPKDEYLIEANYRNPDGIGIAYWKSDKQEVYIKKDFVNIAQFLKWTKDNIKKEDICIIHFRFATHGLKDVGNRHPFPITKNKDLLRKTELICQIAVAHNGVIRQYGGHKKFSDTQKFVMDILAEETIKNNLKERAVIKLINNFIDGDKLAILENDGIIYYFGEFNTHEGIKYSNYSYRKLVTVVSTYDKYGTNWQSVYKKYNLSDKDLESSPVIDTCDVCGEHKLLREVEIENYLYLLCKSCRKKARKGKLEIVREIEDDDYDKVELKECDGCFTNKKIKDLTYFEGLALCSNCKTQFTQVN